MKLTIDFLKNLNTTLVKVKQIIYILNCMSITYLNTTLVKVK